MNIGMSATTRKTVITAARILGVIWAGFWIWFGLASGIGEGLRLSGIIMHLLFPGLLFLLVAATAWRWPNHGAFVLAAVGLLILVGYPIMMQHFPLSTIIFVGLTMGLPPLIMALLLFIATHSHEVSTAAKA